MGEARPLGVVRVSRVGVVDEPDLAAARAHGDLAVGHDLDGTGLDGGALRQREGDELVVVVFGFGLGGSGLGWLGLLLTPRGKSSARENDQRTKKSEQ